MAKKKINLTKQSVAKAIADVKRISAKPDKRLAELIKTEDRQRKPFGPSQRDLDETEKLAAILANDKRIETAKPRKRPR